MQKRFASIWFPYLKTDWYSVRNRSLRNGPFVLTSPDHGRMVITAANEKAMARDICPGMVAADAKAIYPELVVIKEPADLAERLLNRMAIWCIRFSPVASPDPPDGLLLDVTGCTHLWKGDKPYLLDIFKRFREKGYTLKTAMADSIGAAWAVARFGKDEMIINTNQQAIALLSLPVDALRIDAEMSERLYKLGLRKIRDIVGIPRSALRRRFGEHLTKRINQAMGCEEERIVAIQPPALYEERLPCLEPIITLNGIRIALERLLETLCQRLHHEGKGIRKAILRCYLIDGKTGQAEIGTSRASNHAAHLFRLFETRISSLEPEPGIELFVLEATRVEHHSPSQESIWQGQSESAYTRVAELLDRLGNKLGTESIRRYLPDEHHWPERAVKTASSLDEQPKTVWKSDRPRPLQLLSRPEIIQVTAPVPDYPPLNFRYRGTLHKIVKAEGPERIEREWWIDQGLQRDYYYVEDDAGGRYWLFRSGHYTGKNYQWFIHGFFA